MTLSQSGWRFEAKTLTLLSAPIVATQLLQIFVVVLDTLMSGRYNASALAGVAVGGSLWIPIFLFLIGTLSSITPTVAQLTGANKLDQIAIQVHHGFWKILLFYPLVLLVAWVIDDVFVLMKVDEEIAPIGVGYFRALVWGLPAALGYNVLRYYSDGMSFTRPAMTASLIGLLVNAPLNYVLIFGKFGFPEMGGVGCGWASTISFWVMFLYMVVVVRFGKRYQQASLFEKIHWPQRQVLMGLLKLGTPIGLSLLAESSIFSMIALFLAPFGAVQVASHQIALNVASLVFMIPLSLAMALTIRVGHLVGAQQQREVLLTGKLGIAMALIYAAASAGLLALFNEMIARLYNSESEVVLLASSLIIFAAVFQLADSLQVTLAGILRGYKDTRVPMYITVFAFWGIGLPVGYGLGILGWSGEPLLATGFWIGLVSGLASAAVLLGIRYRWLSARYQWPLEEQSA